MQHILSWFVPLLLTGLLALGVGGCATLDSRQTIVACTDLVLDYALYRDQLDVENMAALFTAQARLSVQGNTYVGQEAIRKRIEGAKAGPKTRHLMSTIRIKPVSATKATGISYVTVYTTPGPAHEKEGEVQFVEGFAIIGNYIDEFERTAEGWRIAARRLEGAFRTVTNRQEAPTPASQ